MNRPDSTAKNKPITAEVKLSTCGLEVADFTKNCDCVVAVEEQHFFKKLRNCNCGSSSFKLRNCDCGLERKLLVPTSVGYIVPLRYILAFIMCLTH